MMVLKIYIGLSYEDLVPVIAKTPMYKVFCHIPMDQDVPTDTALMKITKRYGDKVVEVRKIVLEMAQAAKKEITKAKKQLNKFRAESNREQQVINAFIAVAAN